MELIKILGDWYSGAVLLYLTVPITTSDLNQLLSSLRLLVHTTPLQLLTLGSECKFSFLSSCSTLIDKGCPNYIHRQTDRQTYIHTYITYIILPSVSLVCFCTMMKASMKVTRCYVL